jgi:uncharacterized membrane protein (UPF0127 family)
MMLRRLLFAIVLLVAAQPALALLEHFPTGELTIASTNGPHKFQIEIAKTPRQMEQGLMFRRSLAPDAGMLFVDAQGRIVNIRERAVPGSLDTIPAAGPVRATIELNGGTVARLGIKPGDKVLHPIFGTAG